MIGRIVPGAVRTAQFAKEFSLFLICGAVGGFFWANVDSHDYHSFQHLHFFQVAGVEVTMHFLINDILMAFFFAIAAKEVWEALLPERKVGNRTLDAGNLSGWKKASTPLVATLGGVAMPACVYVFVAWIGQELDTVSSGWGITVATDIAFAILVARLVFGSGHPAIGFLLLLAIADDAGGLAILAVFYPQGDVQLGWLLLSATAVGVGLALQRLKVHSFWWYLLIPGVLSWVSFFKAGIHPALGLVPIIPAMPHAKSDFGLFAQAEWGLKDTLNQFEHWWAHPVEVILFLFGLVNAGVTLTQLGPVTWYVMAGLIIGKPLGVGLFTLIGIRIFGLELPDEIRMKDIIVIGSIAGIGFTVALFMSLAAFPPGAIQDAAKMGALFSFGSILLVFPLAIVLGVGRFSRENAQESCAELEPECQSV